MTHVEVVVVGAGPGGLAVAAALKDAGVQALVIDRAPHVGSSWRGHYDRLHLHTPRRWSGLPGFPIPRGFGRWVARDDVVHYLEAYAAHHRLELRLGSGVTRVTRVDPVEHGALRVWLAVRTPPHILQRTRMGVPAQATGILVRRLPPRLVDRVAHVLAAVKEPDLTAYGMPKPGPDLHSRVLVGHLGVLDGRGLPLVHGAHEPPGAAGLWFTGFANPISGMLRELRIDAERIAAQVSRAGASSRA